jgi:peptidyl-dipeptidase A
MFACTAPCARGHLRFFAIRQLTGACGKSEYCPKQADGSFGACLAMRTSKPWPEALKALTGEDKIDGNAMLEYLAPLKTWLDEQDQQLALTGNNVKP